MRARFRGVWTRYRRSRAGSVVEFTLVLPLIVVLMTAMIDAGYLLAQYRQAQQTAESIVRTARVLDNPALARNTLPIDYEAADILRAIAARLPRQSADDPSDYVWLGRYLRPQNDETGAQLPVRQLLPFGVNGYTTNGGALLYNTAVDRVAINRRITPDVEQMLQVGEMVYVVEVGFSRRLITPLLGRKMTFTVRYTL